MYITETGPRTFLLPPNLRPDWVGRNTISVALPHGELSARKGDTIRLPGFDYPRHMGAYELLDIEQFSSPAQQFDILTLSKLGNRAAE